MGGRRGRSDRARRRGEMGVRDSKKAKSSSSKEKVKKEYLNSDTEKSRNNS